MKNMVINMEQKIIKMEHSHAWHDLLHVMQSGTQSLTPEQMDAVIYHVCTDLDILKDRLSPAMYSLIIGLLAEQVLRSGKQNNKLAVVKGINDVH